RALSQVAFCLPHPRVAGRVASETRREGSEERRRSGATPAPERPSNEVSRRKSTRHKVGGQGRDLAAKLSNEQCRGGRKDGAMRRFLTGLLLGLASMYW